MLTKNQLDKLNIITVRGAKPTFFILIAIFMALLIFSCADTSDGGSSAAENPVTLTEIAREPVTLTGGNTKNSVRDRWGLFSVKAKYEIPNYRIGVKLATEPAPTAAQMDPTIDKNVKVYNLNTTPINIILAMRLGTNMVSFFDMIDVTSNSYVTKFYVDSNDITLTNSGAEKLSSTEQHKFRNSMLEPNTKHIVYGMVPGSEVINLLSFTTDAINTDKGLGEIIEPALNKITITYNSANYEIFPFQIIPTDFVVNTPLVQFGDGDKRTIRINQGSFNINPNVKFGKTFYFFTGRYDEYVSDEAKYISLGGWYIISKGFADWNEKIFPARIFSGVNISFNSTINYQQ